MRSSLGTTATTALLTLALGLPVAALADEAGDAAASLEAAERAFAQTMADRDHAAFTAFLADETVFFGRSGEIRGKNAVAAAWRPFFDGETAPFSWHPDTATVLDDGSLGLTSGPVLDPTGERIGTFNSVWRRQVGGGWKIVFDRGCPDCECPEATSG